MKRLVFASAVVAAGFCSPVAHAAAPTECFPNPAAVFSAHPNAAHASYVVRRKRSGGAERCWHADAFRAAANARRPLRSVAAIGRTSAPRHRVEAPTPQRRRATAMRPASRWRAVAVAPDSLERPVQIPPAIQAAVNKWELSQLLPVDESPADFNSRFSASGYKTK